ncbi:MAG TPA: DegT/DnrJ/EryC1/StrS family aminotransferase [Candidatus Omnitrophota bacterium]|nr:DegT/DnrJ/EryC1/StrS family aminotransferase [Candidatus Omnitrophota bacterium]HQL42077.1 DegT/DnrJ/EryC1/StrS family aminotransferase [Candidatus Omnitrophota bacterium]
MIPITKPFLTEDEVELARQAILSGWVTQGPRVKEFEDKFASFVGAKHACAVSSCTTALHLALLAVGVRPGDIVLTVSHSFIATANSARYCAAEPVFVDVEKDGYNMCPDHLEKILTQECLRDAQGLWYRHVKDLLSEESPLVSMAGDPSRRLGRIAAIIAVHQLGFPCQMERILTLAKRFNIPVIEDAAYGIGSEISVDQGKTFEKIGKPHGDIACFSFHPRKILVTGEGGMLTTNDSAHDSFFRLFRHQGMGVSDLARHQANKVILEEYLVTGFNYRMSDIQASIGLGQLKKLPLLLAKLKEIAAFYADALSKISWLQLPSQAPYAINNWGSFPVRLTPQAPVTQEQCMQRLLDRGIATRPGVMNAHRQKPYRSSIWNLPETEKARDTTILLPAFYQITKEELCSVVQAIAEI